MSRPRVGLSLSFVFASVLSAFAQVSPTTAAPAAAHTAITVPAGTKLGFANLRAVPAKTAASGTALYLQTTYPVALGDAIAIPVGSFLQATITGLTKPTKKKSHAYITVAFSKLVLPSGYTVALAETQTLDVQVSLANDLLLDNGTQAEITLSQPVRLSARQIAASLPLAKAVHPEKMPSGTRCVPTPGTPGSPGSPGTPDITIPGNPGTPDTVIPGVDGAPDTVIPGIPATAPTIIPGMAGTPDDPGTAGTYCPNPPLVVGSTPVTTAVPAMISSPVTPSGSH